MSGKELGLYIHIPFCKAKCSYCDFNSFSGKEELIPAYFEALKKEAFSYSVKLRENKIKSIFIGGGTPSAVDSKYIYEILNAVFYHSSIERGCEISMESNPGTLNYEKLTAYKTMGINRLSIGMQAFQNHLLKKMGRIHTVEEFESNFFLARKAGFKNINIDLIFGIPGQTLRDWEKSLDRIIELKPEHVSCYSLKIEEGTVFGNLQEAGELDYLEDEIDRDMYHLTIEKLGIVGLKHYEISNFAREGYQCKHNLVYWQAQEYLGLGAGSHSYLEGIRFNNTKQPEDYIRRLNENQSIIEEEIKLEQVDKMSEVMILGLRLVKGVNLQEFKDRFKVEADSVYGDKIKSLVNKQLLNRNDDQLALTEKGLDLANQVFVEFI